MRIFFLSTLFFVLLCTNVQAIPAFRQRLIYTQPDGACVSYYLLGDEHFHAYFSADGYLLKTDTQERLCYATLSESGQVLTTRMPAHDRDKRSTEEQQFISSLQKPVFDDIYKVNFQRLPLKGSIGTTFPTKGNVKGIVLLVQFKDNKFSCQQDVFYKQMNAKGYSLNGATGSVADYFQEASMGTFNPSFDVIGPILLNNPASYYGANDDYGNDKNVASMIVEACQQAHDKFDVDFSKYDCNNDGKVDFVYVVYAGYGESYGAPSTTIWPRSYNLSTDNVSLTINGKQIDKYACSCELRGTKDTVIDGIGTFCHEFSHVLGLPDYYQTTGQYTAQMGIYDLMDLGSYNNNSKTPAGYSAFDRYCLGWLTFSELNKAAKSITLPELSENNIAYRIPTDDENEYFVLENRQGKNFDATFPAKGLMITHIKYNKRNWANNTVNNDENKPGYVLVPADNIVSYTDTVGMQGDFFPGCSNNISFTDDSTPSSRLWDGGKTRKPITNICNKDGVVTFDFMQNTGITLNTADCVLIVKGNLLHIRSHTANNTRIDIYTPDGRNIYNTTFCYETEVELPHNGLYIVRTGTTLQKVFIEKKN